MKEIMDDIRIDTLRISQESADFDKHYKQFYIVNDITHAPYGIFLMRNQKHGHSGDNIYYKTLEEAIETAMVFVKNKYRKPKTKYRVTLEISSNEDFFTPADWRWKELVHFNELGDIVEVVDCEKLS